MTALSATLHVPTDAPAEPAGRRLLLLSYHFPPGQATGALRWQKLAAFAAERGWGVDVVTLHPDDLPAADYGRLAELPPGTRIFGVPKRVPAAARWEDRAARWVRRLRGGRRAPSSAPGAPTAAAQDELVMRAELRWLPHTARDLLRPFRAWLFFEGEATWARDAARVALGVARGGGYAAVVTCGPPHMVHLAGRAVARRTELPLVMDMRDPWSLARAVFRSMASPLWFRLAERHERRSVRSAALVVTNTEHLRRAMQALHPDARDRIIAVMNGCDDDPLPPTPERRRFTVAYAGNIYLDRDPRPLFRAAARVVRREGLTPDEFRIEFLGHVQSLGDVPLEAMAAAEGVGAYVDVHPRRPRGEALAFLAGASVLLSLPQGVDLAIPSKLFEYMQFPAWILALAAPGSATELLLRGTAADVVDPGDVDALERVLRERFLQHRAGIRPEPVNADGRFGRRRQAEILFDALEARVGRP
jgi:glycosyltransferase involved in cell wall biosynthesis